MSLLRRAIESRMVKLDSTQRLDVVRQAEFLLAELYVHLPQKEAGKAVRPLQQLRLLRARVEQDSSRPVKGKNCASDTLSDAEFHEEMIRIFAGLKDVHTRYEAITTGGNPPKLYFNLRAVHCPACAICKTPEKTRFIVTNFCKAQVESELNQKKIGHDFGSFDNGVIVTHWNGVAIERAISLVGESLYGANSDAQFAQGLRAMTNRSLKNAVFPIEDFIDITYLARDALPCNSEFHAFSIRFPWELDEEIDDSSCQVDSEPFNSFVSISYQESVLGNLPVNNLVCQCSPAAPRLQVEDFSKRDSLNFCILQKLPDAVAGEPSEAYGYLQLNSFEFESLFGDFLEAIAGMNAWVSRNKHKLLKGLIIDVRDNQGGGIEYAEEIMQFLSTRCIEPTDFQVRATPAMLKLSRGSDEYNRWNYSLEETVKTGEVFSSGRWILSHFGEYLQLIFDVFFAENKLYSGFEKGNKKYVSRVNTVLLVNSHSYSACDIFAAAFNDFDLGIIIGTDGETGAGGSNVVSHNHLVRDYGTILPELKSLPDGISMRISIKRALRRGRNTGLPLEDLGVLVKPENREKLEQGDYLDTVNKLNLVLLEKATKRIDTMAMA